jgi:glycine/D-amino acid oxidase-like deaminating enzyme
MVRHWSRVTYVRVDILIVGGGIQGLAMLRELSDAGHRCLLVTNGELGDGQTLHSHGLLNSGTGMVTGETYADLVAHVVPALRKLGVPVYGDERSYLSLPPPMVEQLRPVWAAHGYRPEPVAEEEVLEEIRSPWTFYRVPGYHVPKRRLVAALTSRFEPYVVRGEIAGARDDTYLVAAGTGAEEVEVQADAVVVAAGCGSIPVLQRLDVSAAEIVTRVGYIKSHMMCLRAPAGFLPQIGTVATPQLAVVGHFNRDHDTVGADDRVSWYVTPAVGEPTWYDTAPEDAVAKVEAEVVAQGVALLEELFPLLKRLAPSVEATVFAGFKQNVDGQMTRRLFSCVERNRGIYLALPSVLVHAFTNGRDAVRAFEGTAVGRSNHLAPVPGHNLPKATVGHVNELKAGVEWLPWTRFREMYRL